MFISLWKFIRLTYFFISKICLKKLCFIGCICFFDQDLRVIIKISTYLNRGEGSVVGHNRWKELKKQIDSIRVILRFGKKRKQIIRDCRKINIFEKKKEEERIKRWEGRRYGRRGIWIHKLPIRLRFKCFNYLFKQIPTFQTLIIVYVCTSCVFPPCVLRIRVTCYVSDMCIRVHAFV